MLKLTKKSYVALGVLIPTLIIGGCVIWNRVSKDVVYCEDKTNGSNENHTSFGISCGTFEEFLSSSPSANTAFIFEPNGYHHECLPGYAKYFVDLGYSVEALIQKGNEDSLKLFESKDKIKIFSFDDLNQVSDAANKVSLKLKSYSLALLQSTDPNKKSLIEKSGFLKNVNTLFIAHDVNLVKNMGMQYYFNQNRVLTLGEFDQGVYVNPHYFGNIPKKRKNIKTRFFITSSEGRKYENLINAAEELKRKNLDFEVIVTGRSSSFNSSVLPENLKDNFSFKHYLSYTEMYSEVENSDFIIINLDPENPDDIDFKNCRCTGSAQLVYGFLKPAIIHKDFAKAYKFDSENSLVHSGNDIYKFMEEAVNMKNEDYVNKQSCLEKTSQNIYNTSLENLKKCIKK